MRTLLAASAVILLFVAPATAMDASTLFKRGVRHFENEEHDAAIKAFSRAIALNPKFAEAYAQRGLAWLIKNNSLQAVADLDQAARLDPKLAKVHLSRARFYEKQGKWEEMFVSAKAAYHLAPADTSVSSVFTRLTYQYCFIKSLSASSKADNEEIVARLSEIIGIDPGFDEAYFLKTGILFDNEEYGRAYYSAYESVMQFPTQGRGYANRGLASVKQGKYEQAVADFTKAAYLDPDLGRSDLVTRPRKEAEAVLARQAIIKSKSEDSEKNQPLNPLNVTSGATPVENNSQLTAPTVSTADLIALPSMASVTEARVALIIGNGSYAGYGQLDNSIRDANSVARALREAGFKTVQLRTDLGVEAMRRTLNEFSSEADHADWAVVYFAGHGMEMNGVNYLVPIDARLKTDRAVQFEAVPLDMVLTSIGGARKLRLVILDACRDNPFLSQMTRTMAMRSGGSQGLAKVDLADSGTLVAFAAKHGQQAADGIAGQANSPFASALIRNMTKPSVDVRIMFGMVRDDVMKETKRQQEPYVYGSLGGDSFFFRAR